MPLTLTVHATRRRFVDRPSRLEAWQLLHREADRLYPALRTLWQTVFTDMREAIDQQALQAALETGNLLAVDAVLAPVWAQGETTARGVLPALLRETVERAAAAVTPALQATLEVAITVRFNVVNDAAVSWIESYAGEQIRDISAGTRQAVRDIVRRQFTEGRSVTQVMADLESQVGLTPRQAQAVERLRGRLTEEGIAPSRVQRQVDAAARQALRLRVEAISRTESITASLAGQDRLWHAAAEQGILDRERFRRFWLVTPDDRLCTRICEPIPSMNPEGVALGQPFQTPRGPVMFPAAHPLCRCAVNGRVTSAAA